LSRQARDETQGKLHENGACFSSSLQLDGNLVLINPALKALWSTGTVDNSCAPQHCQVRLELSAEGKLRAVAGNGAVENALVFGRHDVLVDLLCI
jgi:hypothetical protein